MSSHEPESWIRLHSLSGPLLAESSTKWLQKEDRGSWNLPQNFLLAEGRHFLFFFSKAEVLLSSEPIIFFNKCDYSGDM